MLRAVVHDRDGPPDVLRVGQAADAARYVETQQKTGNVVLTVNASQTREAL